MGVRIFVFCTKPSDRYLAGRTSRSLLNAGLSAQSLDDLPLPSILDRIRLDQGPMLLVRAGAWLARAGELKFPNPSATDRPLCALGTLRLPPDCRDNYEAEANQWQQFSLWQFRSDFPYISWVCSLFFEPACV